VSQLQKGPHSRPLRLDGKLPRTPAGRWNVIDNRRRPQSRIKKCENMARKTCASSGTRRYKLFHRRRGTQSQRAFNADASSHRKPAPGPYSCSAQPPNRTRSRDTSASRAAFRFRQRRFRGTLAGMAWICEQEGITGPTPMRLRAEAAGEGIFSLSRSPRWTRPRVLWGQSQRRTKCIAAGASRWNRGEVRQALVTGDSRAHAQVATNWSAWSTLQHFEANSRVISGISWWRASPEPTAGCGGQRRAAHERMDADRRRSFRSRISRGLPRALARTFNRSQDILQPRFPGDRPVCD